MADHDPSFMEEDLPGAEASSPPPSPEINLPQPMGEFLAYHPLAVI
jgi:hypothetical protein